jgi:hypothetical protein
MNEFTYEAPNEDSFLEALVTTLKTKHYDKIANLLSGSKCTIINTQQWARYHGGTLWNGYAVTINLAVPTTKYPEANSLADEEKDIIKKFGNELIQPQITGLEITKIDFTVLLREIKPLEPETCKSEHVTYDETTELARSLLYTLENALRYFVSTNLEENNGFLDESIRKNWKSSKRKEALPPRQPIECDLINFSNFEQLKRIIVQNENWEKIFKSYFGRPDGVISRLNELDDIRDTIAHNRIISTFDFNSFKTLYKQIMGCIEKSTS